MTCIKKLFLKFGHHPTENTINCNDIEDKIFQPIETFIFPKTAFGKRERDHVNQTGLKSSQGCMTIRGLIGIINYALYT